MTIQAHSPSDLLGELNSVEQKNAPEALYTSGDVSLLSSGARVSIVGPRKATPEALKRSASMAKALVDRHITVVSGLAEGVDTAAHRAAIAHGGRTIAVLGTPLDRAFPASNRELQDAIGAQHLLVSQFPVGERTYPSAFPMRNRTMALISDATVVVDAGEKSGTRHQGWEALRLGRRLFLMESFVDASGTTWANEMLEYGAEVLSRENLDSLLSLIPEREAGERLAF